MADPLDNSVARVLEMTRDRRKPARATPIKASRRPSVPSRELVDDLPQLHLAESVAIAASGDDS
jgi:hypothetical protein